MASRGAHASVAVADLTLDLVATSGSTESSIAVAYLAFVNSLFESEVFLDVALLSVEVEAQRTIPSITSLVSASRTSMVLESAMGCVSEPSSTILYRFLDNKDGIPAGAASVAPKRAATVKS